MRHHPPRGRRESHLLTIIGLLVVLLTTCFNSDAAGEDILDDLAFFAGLSDRTSGTRGNEEAIDHITQSFESAGLENVGSHRFLAPVPEVLSASLEVRGETLEIFPWGPNVVYLPMTPKEGLRGPMVYVGDGSLDRFDGKTVQGSIVLMDMESLDNWMNAALLGARALVFLGSHRSVSGEFKQKDIPTPVAFPRFWVTPESGAKLRSMAGEIPPEAVVKCRTRWQNKVLQNIYGFLPGKNPELKNQLVVLDAFYDSSSHVVGLSPGADEAISISMLLHLARQFARDPPDRSILFLATGGNAQSLAGTRHFVHVLTARKKLLRKERKDLEEKKKSVDRDLELLQQEANPLQVTDAPDRSRVMELLVRGAKDRADLFTREAQYQRMSKSQEFSEPVQDARPYRLISWAAKPEDLSPQQQEIALRILREAVPDLREQQKELKRRIQALKSSNHLRNRVDEYNPVLFLSLHLSSHSPSMGLVEMGESYPIRENVKRMLRSPRLMSLFYRIASEVSRETGTEGIIRETSGSSASGEILSVAHHSTHLCCDVGVIAGLTSLSLMSLDDNRCRWSTPHDTLEHVDSANVKRMALVLPPLLQKLFSHESLPHAPEGGIRGLAGLEGRANFIRQGELFPDQPASGTIISVFQKDSIFRTMVNQDGTFFMPGLANNRVALEKLIIEPYGLDPETGRISRTADKKQTGKINYRVKVKTDLASVSLVMFHCRQTDVLPVFNPGNLGYLTKVELLDAATETTPLKHWYSRVDGRNTNAVSIFLEKGTRFKLIMSESLLAKELFFLNSSIENPTGGGFLIADPQIPPLAPYHAANDLRLLVAGRLKNLVDHGIINRHLESLYESASGDLVQARESLNAKEYGKFRRLAGSALAKLNGVYDEIERNQRDVLAGVMFFIALFVPFAHCMERFLFAFRGIYQQITAFLLILLMTIFTIRALHPAFQLTYSPMVVIIAFFIVGLSLLVSWIIFIHFEEQMARMESRAAHLKTPEASKWQSFGAGLSIGVSNLNRRKLRTGLTCLTLIILTFTVMSFTNVKSLHKTTRTMIAEETPYEGVLLRHQYRLPLTLLPLEDMRSRFGKDASVWPRGWVEPGMHGDRTLANIYSVNGSSPVEGILGLGADPPAYFRKMVEYGHWFGPVEDNSIILPLAMAGALNLDPQRDLNATVRLMGESYRVVGFIDGAALQSSRDLDQETILPAYPEVGHTEELTEAEVEAVQSGEVILPQTSRFRYANGNLTVIIPFERALQCGGNLMSISIIPAQRSWRPLDAADELSTWLGFPLFVGENGTWFHSASTTMRYQGVTNLLVPILIVIFITLNTMIGHVHERQREIGTYTSVGLAPTHVGFLFIVEALSLAVISTVIGYILAQLSAKYLGNTALFSQLTFNYSSLASVACMFLVFSVVFLAALYPARMAAVMAMPDVERSWTLPEPRGEGIYMTLPFLFKHEEEKGIMGFLNAYYVSHEDAAQESFIADDTVMNIESPEMHSEQVPGPLCLLIRANVWLEPFDFGIKQRIQLHCCPSRDDPGYLEIAIQMIRISGERSAWVRANRNFIKGLRKQLLLWRFLNTEAKIHYSSLVPLEYAGRAGGALS